MRNPTSLFKDSLDMVLGRRPLILSILLVPIIVSVLVALVAPSRETGVVSVPEWSAYLVLSLASAVVNILLSLALILVFDGRAATAREAFRMSGRLFWRYLGLSIVQAVVLFIAFLLLIIPGIIMSVWLAFSAFILVLEGAGIKDSLFRSREYVRGRWWPVFVRLLALGVVLFIIIAVLSGVIAAILPAAIAEMVTMVLSLLLVPWSIGYAYLLYRDVKGPESQPAVSEPVMSAAM